MYTHLKQQKLLDFISTHPNEISWYHISSFADFEMIIQHPEFTWDWDAISHKIKGNTVLEHPDLPWNWFSLSQRIPMDMIIQHPDLPWDGDGICMNPTQQKYMKLMKVDSPITIQQINLLCQYTDIDIWDYIQEYQSPDWNQFHVSIRPEITWERIQSNNSIWDWDGVSMNPNITIDLILEFPDKPWNWNYLSHRMSVEVIQMYPDLPWDWGILSNHMVIPDTKLLHTYPDKPWDWGILCLHPSITPLIIEQFPDKPWDWYILSSHPNMNWDQFSKISDELLNWNQLSVRMSFDIIQTFPDKPWSWSHLCKNPTIPIEWFFQHENKINWTQLSQNPQFDMEWLTYHKPWDIYAFSICLPHQYHFLHPELKKYMNEFVFPELISVCFQPNRLNWVLDDDQKKSWNLK